MLREPGQALDTPGNFCRVGPSHLLESELLPEVHTMFAAQPAWAKVLGAAGLAIAFVAGSSFGPHTSPARAGLTADLLPGVAPASDTSSVVVTGTAIVQVTPDLAHISVSVQTSAPTATRAAADDAALVARVRTHVQQSGVRPDDIKTISFGVFAQYDYRNGTQPALLTGFTANHTLELTVRDLARIGSTIDAAVAGGATTVQGISYDTSDRGGHEAAALAAAVKDAHTKAQAMATAAGISLGNVLSINASQQYAPYPFPMMGAARAGSADTQIAPPNVQLTVSVIVSWAIAR